MISHEHRCLLIHIPKVAGTSVMTVFGDPHPASAVDRGPLPFDPDDPMKFTPPPPHLRARDYVATGRLTRDQFDGYFKFAFVRNPWDRLVSEYRYRLHPMRYGFKSFVFDHFPRPTWDDRYCHVLPQYDFLHDDDGRLLVDFVGRFETLQADFDRICEKVGLPPTPLPRDNASRSVLGRRRDDGWCGVAKALAARISPKARRNTFAHYRDYYDDETRDFVAALYRKDIEAFGYRF